MDFTVQSTKTRDGLMNVYSYEGNLETKVAGAGIDVAVMDGEPWTDPSNITLNMPGTYASVTLNQLTSFSVRTVCRRRQRGHHAR